MKLWIFKYISMKRRFLFKYDMSDIPGWISILERWWRFCHTGSIHGCRCQQGVCLADESPRPELEWQSHLQLRKTPILFCSSNIHKSWGYWKCVEYQSWSDTSNMYIPPWTLRKSTMEKTRSNIIHLTLKKSKQGLPGTTVMMKIVWNWYRGIRVIMIKGIRKKSASSWNRIQNTVRMACHLCHGKIHIPQMAAGTEKQD